VLTCGYALGLLVRALHLPSFIVVWTSRHASDIRHQGVLRSLLREKPSAESPGAPERYCGQLAHGQHAHPSWRISGRTPVRVKQTDGLSTQADGDLRSGSPGRRKLAAGDAPCVPRRLTRLHPQLPGRHRVHEAPPALTTDVVVFNNAPLLADAGERGSPVAPATDRASSTNGTSHGRLLSRSCSSQDVACSALATASSSRARAMGCQS
jgi:hypothetical protein